MGVISNTVQIWTILRCQKYHAARKIRNLYLQNAFSVETTVKRKLITGNTCWKMPKVVFLVRFWGKLDFHYSLPYNFSNPLQSKRNSISFYLFMLDKLLLRSIDNLDEFSYFIIYNSKVFLQNWTNTISETLQIIKIYIYYTYITIFLYYIITSLEIK